MAVRPNLLTLESASTGGIRSVRVDVDEDGGGIHIYRDSDYDNGADCEIAVALRSTAGSPATSIGATWQQLQGDGQRFELPSGLVFNLHIYGRVLGPWLTEAPTPDGSSAFRPPRDVPPGQPDAYQLEIGTDGWLRPASAQNNDFYFSMRTVDVPRAVTHRYTDIERVKVILRSVKNREAGFDANFEGRLNDAIASAEKRIDAYCGRTFDRAVTQTRNYRVRNRNIILTDDFNFGSHVEIHEADSRDPVNRAHFDVRRWSVGYNVARTILPRLRDWKPQAGDLVSVTADFGWPEIPAEVVDYAGRLASEIFKFDSAQAGLMSVGGDTAYGATPGRHIRLALGHLRAGRVG